MVEVLASEEHGVVGVSLGTTGTAMSSNQVGRTGGTGVLDAVLESAGSSTELTMELAACLLSISKAQEKGKQQRRSHGG